MPKLAKSHTNAVGKRPELPYRLSDDAQRDLIEIYLESEDRFGPQQADRYLDRLAVAFERLVAYPRIARSRSEFGGSRIQPVAAHIVVYRIDGDIVFVQRIRHGHEDWQTDLAPGDEGA